MRRYGINTPILRLISPSEYNKYKTKYKGRLGDNKNIKHKPMKGINLRNIAGDTNKFDVTWEYPVCTFCFDAYLYSYNEWTMKSLAKHLGMKIDELELYLN